MSRCHLDFDLSCEHLLSSSCMESGSQSGLTSNVTFCNAHFLRLGNSGGTLKNRLLSLSPCPTEEHRHESFEIRA